MEDFTVKTFLRPDYYEFFPRFSSLEIASRVRRMPLPMATLLNTYNIGVGIRDGILAHAKVKDFLLLRTDEQAFQMADMLESVGISKKVALAMKRVPRHSFCPKRDVSFAYLDASVLYDTTSCLSSPSIVALMLDRMNPMPGMRFLDIGFGSGYHAHCVSELCSHECQICGLEINEGFLSLAKSTLEQTRIQTIKTAHGDLRDGWPGEGKFDCLYGAVALGEDLPSCLLNQVNDGGTVQYARPLNREEFFSEPPHSWLRTEFENYDAYRQSWGAFCCLVRGKKFGNRIRELDRLLM